MVSWPQTKSIHGPAQRKEQGVYQLCKVCVGASSTKSIRVTRLELMFL